MSTLPAPCLTCGTATTLTMGRCADCNRPRRREQARAHYARNGRRSRPERDLQANAWRHLSRKARALQPFCSDCHRTPAQLDEHEQLEADHTPQAWHRVLSGLAIRLQDIDVVCGPCNRARGDAQPSSPRYQQWEAQQDEHEEMSARWSR